ncbi:S-layer homology domain-containing protein [Sporosarcina sp. FA9]|uniref:S-layer homology domain-containing protein n=1 Tax=Sporosarcina sp. FA9 TaxID=3413030 RepID=UPI003F657477
MRKIVYFSLMFLLAFSLMPIEKADAATFPDVKQYKEEIEYLTNRGIIQGYGDGMFKPEQALTRLEAVQTLLKAKGITDLTAPNPNFTDMSPGTPGYEEVAKAVQLGIISGKTAENGTKYFDSTNQLTRGQMAKVIVKTGQFPERNTTLFSDVPKSNGFHNDISTLAAERITGGYPDGKYLPNNAVSRQHFAAFVARMLDDKFKPAKVNEVLSYLMDKTKTYVFEADVIGFAWTETMTYAGTKYTGSPGWDLWKSVDMEGDVSYTIATENSNGLFYKGCENGTTCDGDSITELKYPLSVGQTWETTMFTIGTYTIVSTNRTVTTKAGTFHNVVEVKSNYGDLLYYAPNVGNIKTVAFGMTVLELVELK